jgi:hypothetical protein
LPIMLVYSDQFTLYQWFFKLFWCTILVFEQLLYNSTFQKSMTVHNYNYSPFLLGPILRVWIIPGHTWAHLGAKYKIYEVLKGTPELF